MCECMHVVTANSCYTGSVAVAIINVWEQNERLERASGSDRKRKTSAAGDRGILREVRRDRFVFTVDILALAPYLHLSASTISRRIRESGEFDSYWAAHKPFISPANRAKRLQWCRARQHWSMDEWCKVLWTDESPFVLRFNRKKRVWWRQYAVQCMTGSVKHDKKIMVRGCFAAHGVGALFIVDGILEQRQYRDILDTYMLVPSKEVL